MPLSDWDDRDEDELFPSLSPSRNEWFRGSCENASRYEPAENCGYPTQVVYPIEHGVGCKGHRRFVDDYGVRPNPQPWVPDWMTRTMLRAGDHSLVIPSEEYL